MTLDEAIQHAQEIADKGCDQCAKDHQQLAKWLTELKNRREKDPNLNLVKTFTNICELKVKSLEQLEPVKPMQLPHIDMRMRLCDIYNIKDGDILYYNNDIDKWIFIFKDVNGVRTDMKKYHELQYYVFCFEGIKDFVELNNSCLVDINKVKFATDEQKQTLFNALKTQGYEWNPENKKILKDSMKQNDLYATSLRYIYENKAGKYSDLCDIITDEMVRLFASAGFIKTGYTINYKTWGITELGKQYFEDFYV